MRIRNAHRRFMLAILGLALVMHGTEGRAQTVAYEDGFATGIRNLRLNNSCLDVQFVDGSYVSAYEVASPMFLNQPVAADQAADAIMNVLNDQRLVPALV